MVVTEKRKKLLRRSPVGTPRRKRRSRTMTMIILSPSRNSTMTKTRISLRKKTIKILNLAPKMTRRKPKRAGAVEQEQQKRANHPQIPRRPKPRRSRKKKKKNHQRNHQRALRFTSCCIEKDPELWVLENYLWAKKIAWRDTLLF